MTHHQHYTDKAPPEIVSRDWSIICDLQRTDERFTTSKVARKYAQSEKTPLKTAMMRCDVALKRVLKEGSPDLLRIGNQWLLPSIANPDRREP